MNNIFNIHYIKNFLDINYIKNYFLDINCIKKTLGTINY